VNTFSLALGDKACYEKFRYPAGEMQVRLNAQTNATLRSASRVIVTARIKSAEDIIELCMLISAIRSQSSVEEIKLVLPYLPYARADRRFVEGDCFGLEVFAELLNGLGLSVYTLDAHSVSSRNLVKNLTDLCPSTFINKAIEDVRRGVSNLTDRSQDSLTLLFPDDGAKKRYAGFVTGLNITTLHCAKVRDKASGHLSGFSVPALSEFDSKNVLMIDDICDGGGTFLGVAEALKQYNLNISLYVTHGIFSKGLDSLLSEFRRIYTTDSFGCQLSNPRLIAFQTEEFFKDSLCI
jgi:ribose-phosphate pyrophosphokinase